MMPTVRRRVSMMRGDLGEGEALPFRPRERGQILELCAHVHGDDDVCPHPAHDIGGQVIQHSAIHQETAIQPERGEEAGQGASSPYRLDHRTAPQDHLLPALQVNGHQRQRDPQIVEGYIPQPFNKVSPNPLALEEARFGEQAVINELDQMPQPAHTEGLLLHGFSTPTGGVESSHYTSHAGAGQEIHWDSLSL